LKMNLVNTRYCFQTLGQEEKKRSSFHDQGTGNLTAVGGHCGSWKKRNEGNPRGRETQDVAKKCHSQKSTAPWGKTQPTTTLGNERRQQEKMGKRGVRGKGGGGGSARQGPAEGEGEMARQLGLERARGGGVGSCKKTGFLGGEGCGQQGNANGGGERVKSR